MHGALASVSACYGTIEIIVVIINLLLLLLLLLLQTAFLPQQIHLTFFVDFTKLQLKRPTPDCHEWWVYRQKMFCTHIFKMETIVSVILYLIR